MCINERVRDGTEKAAEVKWSGRGNLIGSRANYSQRIQPS